MSNEKFFWFFMRFAIFAENNEIDFSWPCGFACIILSVYLRSCCNQGNPLCSPECQKQDKALSGIYGLKGFEKQEFYTMKLLWKFTDDAFEYLNVLIAGVATFLHKSLGGKNSIPFSLSYWFPLNVPLWKLLWELTHCKKHPNFLSALLPG